MQLIETTQQLYDFCQLIWQDLLLSENFITVDTEFQRERTYYPQLSLIQIASHQHVGLIDALSPDLDLSPLWQIMIAPEITKVFHAARQDMEIFYLVSGQIPTPIFDTQIAAMVCGFNESVGYDTLVQYYVHETVDKSWQKTDWLRRPLSTQQIQYAAHDVIYLRKIYRLICTYLIKKERHDWFKDELDILTKPETYTIDVDQVWRRLKLKNQQGDFLVRLQALARLRELWAREQNRPRAHTLSDELLIDLATIFPKSTDTIPYPVKNRLKYLTIGQKNDLLVAMDQAMQLPREHWPRLPRSKTYYTDSSPQLTILLDFFLSLRAEQLHIVPRLLATRDELALLVHKKQFAAVRSLTGWRYDVFGKEALALLNGEATLKVEGKRVLTTFIA